MRMFNLHATSKPVNLNKITLTVYPQWIIEFVFFSSAHLFYVRLCVRLHVRAKKTSEMFIHYRENHVISTSYSVVILFELLN
jgi:hypothetical protein